jgi:hypothetical protein
MNKTIIIADNRGLWNSKEAKKFIIDHEYVIIATQNKKIMINTIKRKVGGMKEKLILYGYHLEKHINKKTSHIPNCIVVHSQRDVKRLGGNTVFIHQVMFQHVTAFGYIITKRQSNILSSLL